MELQSKMPSALFSNEQTDEDLNSTQSGDNLKWDQEISFEEAYKAIERTFYGFKKVLKAIYNYYFNSLLSSTLFNQTSCLPNGTCGAEHYFPVVLFN